jgi:hypothetical protein
MPSKEEKQSELNFAIKGFVLLAGLALSLFSAALWFLLRVLMGMNDDSSVSYELDPFFWGVIPSILAACFCIIQLWFPRAAAFGLVIIGVGLIIVSMRLSLYTERYGGLSIDVWTSLGLIVLGICLFFVRHPRH